MNILPKLCKPDPLLQSFTQSRHPDCWGWMVRWSCIHFLHAIPVLHVLTRQQEKGLGGIACVNIFLLHIHSLFFNTRQGGKAHRQIQHHIQCAIFHCGRNNLSISQKYRWISVKIQSGYAMLLHSTNRATFCRSFVWLLRFARFGCIFGVAGLCCMFA